MDTPGTNAIIRHHEELSRGFVPRSDLVLFVTSVDRPFTESEREYLELIRDWGKKIVLVLNKVDLLHADEERDQVRTFVEEGVRSMLGLRPPIFFVSSSTAQRAKNSENELERDTLLSASGFDELERYVTDLLDEEGRVRLKLESPLGVVEELVRRYERAVEERVSLLEDDFKMSENVELQLELYKEDMKRDFEARMAEIENIILQMNERGDEWFEENIRLANVRELVQRDKIQDRFQDEVVADTEERIDELGAGAHRLDGEPEPQAVARYRGVRQQPSAGEVRRAHDRGGRRQLRVQPLAAPPIRRQERDGRRSALRPRV
ncbi:MAG: dynamin family protein [Actinomycetota bacterium]|nr:dynamin family protein [Actinomycetota bacterium]